MLEIGMNVQAAKGATMSKRMRFALASILLISGSQAIAAKARHSPPVSQTVVIYEGTVDAKSAERLVNLISANTDKIIGLKLTVEKSSDTDLRYYTSRHENQLNITSGDPTDGPVEVLINDGIGTTFAGEFYTADGFYLIKSGGSHAGGALSFGAVPVSEATIRLNPQIHVVKKSF